MTGFPILDLVVGIIFIFFLLSIISSSIVEIILSTINARSKVLGEWLTTTFKQQAKDSINLGLELMDHSAIAALSKKGEAPAYIDARNFATALLDKIIVHSNTEKLPTNLDEMITTITNSEILPPDLKNTFLLYAHEANDTINTATAKTTGGIELFRGKIENWYDTNMERVSGSMKVLYTRRFTFIVAATVTILLNADTIAISKFLYQNPEARNKVVAKALETGGDDTIMATMDQIRDKANTKNNSTIQTDLNLLTITINEKVKTINEANAALNTYIPIGWDRIELNVFKQPLKAEKNCEWIGNIILYILSKFIGFAVSIMAIMMGAPFWFDVLNKISNLRSSGNRPSAVKNPITEDK